MKLAGCISNIELEGEGAVLADIGEAFLRSGGVVSLDEWRSLEQIERAAMVEAGNRLRREQAVLISGAIVDSQFRAQLQGDEAEASEFLREAVERAVEEIEVRRASGIPEVNQ